MSATRTARILGRGLAAAVALASVLGGFPARGAEPAPAPDHTTVVMAAAMIDGLAPKPRANVAVVIRGNRIVAIRDRNASDLPADAERIDLGGATLLPGLIDSHTHIFLQGEVPADGGYDVQLLKHPASFRAARAVVAVHRALEQGFTTLRDVETEGAGYGDVGIKQAIEAGYIPGPRLFVSTVSRSPRPAATTSRATRRRSRSRKARS